MSLSPEVKVQHLLTHALCGFVIWIHWAFRKDSTVNHCTAFPIFHVFCRARELKVIIMFVENLKDDQDVIDFYLEQDIFYSSFRTCALTFVRGAYASKSMHTQR